MYLKQKATSDLVEILDTSSLIDPCRDEVSGRLHWGEEMQEPAMYAKSELVFPSGEPLPRCWLDPNYRT